jgi:hypothetical protein
MSQLRPVDAALALQIIGRLKAGGNVVVGAHLFSVGRERWLRGAEQVLKDLESTGDAFVRFIRGDYGVGKTNFAARLFHQALDRGWSVSYVEIGDEAPMHEFPLVLAAIMANLRTPADLPYLLSGDTSSAGGVAALLDDFYRRVKESFGLKPGADIPATFHTEMLSRADAMMKGVHIDGDFRSAVRAYLTAKVNQDASQQEELVTWFKGGPPLKHLQVFKPISKANAKTHLRHFTSLVIALGCKGTVILLDELETIMSETPARRRKAYGVLRELIDNVDGVGGMRRACLYCAAPPAQFESQKGFIEYEALASRIAELPSDAGIRDYAGTMVDLDKAPLEGDEVLALLKKLRELHSIARQSEDSKKVPDTALRQLRDKFESTGGYGGKRLRDLCREAVTLLDAAWQEDA